MVVPKTAYQKKKVLKAKENVEIFEKREFIHYIYALDEFAGRFLCKVSELLKLIIYAIIVKRLSLTPRTFLKQLTDGGRAFFHPYSLFKSFYMPCKR